MDYTQSIILATVDELIESGEIPEGVSDEEFDNFLNRCILYLEEKEDFERCRDLASFRKRNK